MNIVLLTPFPPQEDSLSTYSMMLANELRRRKHEVTIVANQGRVSRERGVIARFHWSPWQLWILFTKLRNIKPELLHLQYAPNTYGMSAVLLWPFLIICRIFLKTRIIVTFHGVKTSPSVSRRVVSKLFYRFIMYICRSVIVHSYEARDVLVNRYGISQSQVVTLPYPIANEQLPRKSAVPLEDLYELGDARVIVWFGHIRANKGLEYLIKAFDLMRRSDPELKNTLLVIAGSVQGRRGTLKLIEQKDKLYEARLQQLVASRNLKKSVFFTGYIPDEQIAQWLERAAIVVLPHLRSGRGSTLSRVLASQTPIIASDIGAFKEILGDIGVLTPVANAGALSNKLSDFLISDTAAKVVSQYNAIRRPRTIGRVVGKLEKIYQS